MAVVLVRNWWALALRGALADESPIALSADVA
jgi:hypothetical protein